MVETDVLDRLLNLLQDQNSDVCQLSIKAIIAFAKIRRLMYHFLLCKD